MHGRKRSLAWLIVCSLIGVSESRGQCESKQLQKIANPLPATFKAFATQIAFDGATLAASATPTVTGPSKVFVFEKNGAQFTLAAQIGAPDSVAGVKDDFGTAIAIDGDDLFVSSAHPQPNVGGQYFGAVYAWKKVQGTWTFDKKIVPPVGLGEFTGEQIVADGGWLVAPVPMASVVAGSSTIPSAGRLFVYRRDVSGVWQLHSTLAASAPIQNQQLGLSAAIDGTTIAAASQEKTIGTSYGAIHTFGFDGTGWSQTAKLVPSDAGTTTGWFAVSGLGIFGNRIVGSANSAHLHVFEKASSFWVESANVPPPPVAITPDTQYGRPTALGNDVIVAGALGDDAPFTDSGAAYVFTLGASGWEPRIRLKPDDPVFAGSFGSTVAVAGSVVAIGAPPYSGPPSHAVYLMSAVPNPEPDYGVSCAGTGGYAPTLGLPTSFDGCFEAGDTAAFAIEKGLGGSSCLLLVGVAPATIPIPGPCTLLVSPLPASATLPLFGSGPGNGAVAFSATLPLNMPSGSIYLQGFVPDPGVPSGFSATNGLRLTVD